MSIFDGLFSNWVFILIFFIIAFLQAIITEFGGAAFETTHLRWDEWLVCLALGFGSLFIGWVLRLIKVKDMTTQKLNALRAQRKQQMKRRYAGMSVEQQWEMEYVPGKDDDDDKKKKKDKDRDVEDRSTDSVDEMSE